MSGFRSSRTALGGARSPSVYVAVYVLGLAVVVGAGLLTIRLLAPPAGFTFEYWQFANRTRLALQLGAVALAWAAVAHVRFVVGAYDETAFAKLLAASCGISAVSTLAFLHLSPRGGYWPNACGAAVLVVATAVAVRSRALAEEGYDEEEPPAPVKLFWAVVGRFLLPAATIVAIGWVVIRTNADGPLRANVTFLTVIGTLYLAWEQLFAWGPGAGDPSFRPSALHVASMLFSNVLSLIAAYGAAKLAVAVVTADVLPRLAVYFDRLTDTLFTARTVQSLATEAASVGITLPVLLVWLSSAFAVLVGMSSVGWVLEHAGLPVTAAPGSTVIRRGRRNLED